MRSCLEVQTNHDGAISRPMPTHPSTGQENRPSREARRTFLTKSYARKDCVT